MCAGERVREDLCVHLAFQVYMSVGCACAPQPAACATFASSLGSHCVMYNLIIGQMERCANYRLPFAYIGRRGSVRS